MTPVAALGLVLFPKATPGVSLDCAPWFTREMPELQVGVA
jgi:hypothetical protein